MQMEEARLRFARAVHHGEREARERRMLGVDDAVGGEVDDAVGAQAVAQGLGPAGVEVEGQAGAAGRLGRRQGRDRLRLLPGARETLEGRPGCRAVPRDGEDVDISDRFPHSPERTGRLDAFHGFAGFFTESLQGLLQRIR